MLIKTKKTRIPYSQEEKYAFFVEGKIKNPTTCKNKQKNVEKTKLYTRRLL